MKYCAVVVGAESTTRLVIRRAANLRASVVTLCKHHVSTREQTMGKLFRTIGGLTPCLIVLSRTVAGNRQVSTADSDSASLGSNPSPPANLFSDLGASRS